MSDGTDPLAGEKYLRLVTYKRDGTGIGTALWFAEQGGDYVAHTGANTGKVKRIGNNPSVTVSACDARGKARGPERHGRAQLLDPDTDARRVEAALNAKYGIQRKAFMALLGVVEGVQRVARRTVHAGVYLEITLD